MFDVDGTLVHSTDFDERCFIEAVYAVTGRQINRDWVSYPHVTDSGLLTHFFDCQFVVNDEQRRNELIGKIKILVDQKISAHIE